VTCCKCGSAAITGPRYCDGDGLTCMMGPARTRHGEHLDYRCICGYAWSTPTRDAAVAERMTLERMIEEAGRK